MEQTQVDKIFAAVYQLTLEKKIKWVDVPSILKNKEIYKTDVSGYEIRISKSNITTTFSIFTSQTLLGSINENTIVSGAKRVFDLFTIVRRSVLKIDEGLDDLLNKLNKM